MKKHIIIAALAAALMPVMAHASHSAPAGWEIADATLTRDGGLMTVSFDFDMTKLQVPSEEALICTPVLINGADSVELHSIGIYGRNRYIHYERRSPGMITGTDEVVLKNKEKPSHLAYEQIVAYQPWMNGAQLKLRYRDYGCCFTILDQGSRTLANYMEVPNTLRPAYVLVTADSVVVNELEGKAYVQFIVDRTEIRPDFRDNARELSKITSSIDTVKADPDFTITELWLKGFASPESPYSHNADLARGRTQAVKDYVQNLYRFAPGVIVTEYEPEDWAGLREYVAASNLDNRDAILEIIDSPMADLDQKEALIRKQFPKDYAHLKEFAYPPLRHTEYKVTYRVRSFYDVDEIKRVMETEPQKLSLNDFNLAANTYEPGSPEFNEVYEIAVRMYPNSPEANINAANSAMQIGNLTAARAYLEKAGSLPEAEYARGLILLAEGDIAGAKPYVEKAAQQGLSGAAETLAEINQYLQVMAR